MATFSSQRSIKEAGSSSFTLQKCRNCTSTGWTLIRKFDLDVQYMTCFTPKSEQREKEDELGSKSGF